MVLKRGTITIINIFFPPLGVALLCGMDADLFINCMLFLCAIIPSHVHAFYISCTYFNRKRKVRKGRYPGDRRPMIYCERVQNGGASRREVAELREQMLVEKEMKNGGGGLLSKTSSRNSGKSTRRSGRDSGYVTAAQTPTPTSPHSMQSQWTRPQPSRETSGHTAPQYAPNSYASRADRRSHRQSSASQDPQMTEYGRGNGSTRRSQRY
jgi:uncharacterized membrane protein YqaE (UPF0057 family)